jgi:hypothetical protein
VPKTEGFYEDGTYYLRVTYFYENPVDKDEFDGLMYEGMMCDPDELDMAVTYHGDEYVHVIARLARQVPLPQIDVDRHARHSAGARGTLARISQLKSVPDASASLRHEMGEGEGTCRDTGQ